MNAEIDDSRERMLRFLQATKEQQEIIGRILDGKVPADLISRILGGAAPAYKIPSQGPALVRMGAAAETLGVSRATLWRLIKAGRLDRVELLPGCFRVRQAELEAMVAGTKGEFKP